MICYLNRVSESIALSPYLESLKIPNVKDRQFSCLEKKDQRRACRCRMNAPALLAKMKCQVGATKVPVLKLLSPILMQDYLSFLTSPSCPFLLQPDLLLASVSFSSWLP